MNAFKPNRISTALTLSLLAIVAYACTDPPSITDVLVRPTSIAAVGSTNINAVAGQQLTNAAMVVVRDQDNELLPNQAVAFSASRGTLSANSATTNAQGQAAPAFWTAPTIIAGGAPTITANIPGFATIGSVTFTVTVTPGPASSMTKTASTDNLSAVAGSNTASAPEVTIADQYTNPISGVVVTFTIASGGGRLNGSTLTTAQVTSDANGKAKLTSWQLGTTVGANTVTATASGLTQTFTATATLGPPNKIEIAPPGNSQGQTATAGSNVTNFPAVVVKDVNNNVLSGVVVRFAINVGGGKLISSTGTQVTQVDVTTNAQGIATSFGWMVWDLGNNSLAVTIPAASSVAAFAITATSVAGPPTQIAVVTETPSSNNQSAVVNGTVAVAPGAIVKDANGFPVSGVSVTFTVATGGGTIKLTSSGSDVTTGAVTTGADGIARVFSWKLGPAKGANTLTAALTATTSINTTFTATGTAGPPASIAIVTESPSSNNQSTIANTAVPVAPGVVVRDANNVTVDAGVSITFAIQAPVAGVVSATGCTGTATSVTVNTDANGVARLGCWKPGTVGNNANNLRASVTATSSIFVNFQATGTVGPPTQVAFTNSPWATTLANTTNGGVPKVTVTDAGGNGVSGLTVNWSTTNANSTVGAPTSSTTNASGVAQFGGTWTAGNFPGTSMVLQASVASTSLTTTANSIVTGSPGSTNTGQAAPATTAVNTNVTPPPMFIVVDAGNRPIPKVAVTWSITANPGGTSTATLTGSDVLTDSLGRAFAGTWKVASNGGTNTIQGAVSGVSPHSFSTTGVAGAASTIAVSSQSATNATVNTSITANAVVRDQFNNVVSGVNVTFATSTAPSGSATNAAVTSTATVATNASGIASATWRLDTLVRTNTLVATITGSSPAVSATFTAGSTVGTAAKIVKIAGDNQMLSFVDSVHIDPSVRVTDQYNNVVGAGVGVTFSPAAGSGSVLGGSQTTGATGIATVTRWTIGSGSTSTLNAFLTSNSSVTTSFTATQPCVAPATYTAGATVNGTLADTDCQNSNGLDSLTFVDRYRTTVASGQTAWVSVTLTSSAFAPTAQYDIWPAHYWYQVASNPGSTTKYLVLGPGTYDFWATSTRPIAVGAYTLTSASNPALPSGCGDFLITKGASLANGVHSTDATSCNYVSTGTGQSSTPRSSKLYHICTQSSSVTGTTIRMGSSAWDPLLEAYGAGGGAFVKLATGVQGGAQAVLVLDPTPSATCYEIRASHRIAGSITQATAGAYSISVDP